MEGRSNGQEKKCESSRVLCGSEVIKNQKEKITVDEVDMGKTSMTYSKNRARHFF